MIDVWKRIRLLEGDLTQLDVDAIVNAANSTLLGGGGVDGAIHREAGPELLDECRALGGCETGKAKITRGYRLNARHIIHTVGPVYHDGRHDEPALLKSCYESSLKLAAAHGLTSIAFPAISCGVYGYPMHEAARIAICTTATFLESHPDVDRVVFVLFGSEALDMYQQTLDKLSSA